MKKRNIKKKVIQKAPFFIFAEKILENIAILNKYSECPNCKNEIKKNQIICEKCGHELGNKLTFEENMNYIRAYIQDIRYTQDEATQKKIEIYEKIIEGFLKDWKLQELFKEYVTLSDRINSGFFKTKDFILRKNLEKELLKRGFPLVTREGSTWTNSQNSGAILY